MEHSGCFDFLRYKIAKQYNYFPVSFQLIISHQTHVNY